MEALVAEVMVLEAAAEVAVEWEVAVMDLVRCPEAMVAAAADSAAVARAAAADLVRRAVASAATAAATVGDRVCVGRNPHSRWRIGRPSTANHRRHRRTSGRL